MASKKPPQKPQENKVTERLASIVDAAERTALSVIDDAEKEAKLYLEEARARADRIVAERLREEADRIESQGPGDDEAPRLRAVESPPEPDGTAGARPSAATNGGSAAARLLATQMAVSGSSRGEIETRLRDGFEIEDAGEILDAILGPEE
jgi:cell division septum initiation protein DivIVA